MKSVMLVGRYLLVGLVLGLPLTAASCSSGNAKEGVAGSGGSSGAGGAAPTGGGGASATGGAGAAGAAGDGGSSQVIDAAIDANPVGEEPVADAAPPTEEEAAAVVPRGPGVLFSFDDDSDFKSCDPSVIIPPCWQTQIDVVGGLAGSFVPVADEAMAGHSPARALEWTATFPGYDVSVRLGATFAKNEDWTALTRLHFNVRVTSGFSSMRFYQLFIQGGVAASYGSIYQLGSPANLDPALSTDDGSTFRDVSIDLTDPRIDRTVLTSVAGIGLVLRSVAASESGMPDGSVVESGIPDGDMAETDMPDASVANPVLPSGEVAPPPTVIELDNIWLE